VQGFAQLLLPLAQVTRIILSAPASFMASASAALLQAAAWCSLLLSTASQMLLPSWRFVASSKKLAKSVSQISVTAATSAGGNSMAAVLQALPLEALEVLRVTSVKVSNSRV
jgi:small-conductance mechanosensitive channel